jgi:hypothetical protein
VYTGGVYAKLNGMLHSSDLTNNFYLAPPKRAQINRDEQTVVLAKGTPLKVYIKEVFKQAGYVFLSASVHI